MKKILALAAVAALSAGVSAYAANPFSDVSTSDWAYQAVSDLSDQGIVEGYPDGTFKGERNITRYELAQIIARLMAKEDQLNAEQQATINKLASEYADELANLGVRVSNLEKKVGNISWSGNARMRYVEGYDADNEFKANGRFDGRIKITAHADVNDKTYVEGRLRANMNFRAEDDDPEDATANGTVYAEELMVHHQFAKNAAISLGRQDFVLGQTGFMYDDEFDGAILSLGNDKAAVDVGYGKFWAPVNEEIGDDVFLARLRANAGRVGFTAEYIDSNDIKKVKMIGGGLTLGVADNVSLYGDYYVNTDAANDPKSWLAGLGYDNVDLKKPGTFSLGVQYGHVEQGAWLGDSTYDLAPGNLVLAEENAPTEVKFWSVTGDVVLQKNVKLHAQYAFNVKDGAGKDYDDLYMASLNYVF